MKLLIFFAKDHPGLTAFFGSATGWWSWELMARAKDFAQFVAAMIAALVSLCALILTGPQAWERVSGWARRLWRRG